MILPIALTAAGAAALLHIWLSVRVSQVRRQYQIGVGDGGHEGLTRRMRAHGNYAENAPIFLVLIALLELAGAMPQLLWGAVILFFLGRILHAFGMDRGGANPLRAGGIVTTWLVLIGLAGWAIALTYMQPAASGSRLQIQQGRTV